MPEKQIDRKTILIAALLLTITGALHIAYGATYIESGSFVQGQTKIGQQFFGFYQNTLPLGSFSITIGIFLIIFNMALIAVQIKTVVGNENVKNAIWWGVLFSTAFTFALAFMEVWEYNRWSQLLIIFKVNSGNLDSQLLVPYNLGLSSGIIAFVLGLPSSLFLVDKINHRLIEGRRQTDFKRGQWKNKPPSKREEISKALKDKAMTLDDIVKKDMR